MIKELLLAIHFIVMPDVNLGVYGYYIAQDIRSVTKEPLVITSNCRSESTNKKVNGVDNSMHLECKALDIRSRGLRKKTIEEIKQLTSTGRYDIIVEYKPPHIHIELKEGQLTLFETWNDLVQQ